MDIGELILSTVRMATPILLVALAELYSERAGLVNIGLDGIMSFGALTGFMVNATTIAKASFTSTYARPA